MNKTIITAVFLGISWNARCQDYLDVLRVSASNTRLHYNGSASRSSMNAFDANVLVPFTLKENTFILGGVDYNTRRLSLVSGEKKTNLQNLVFKVGVSKNFNERWNGYFVVLPKFAADYNGNFGSSFLIGGLGMLKYKKSENLTYKMGVYASQEAYGMFGTPLFGFFYRSPNKKLMMDFTLPLLADANYSLGNVVSLGLDFMAVRRSFFLRPHSTDRFYVENNEISFTPYSQFGLLGKKLLIKTKVGYSTADFGTFKEGDANLVGISAFNIGKERTQLNAQTTGGLQFKIEAIYRFYTPSRK